MKQMTKVRQLLGMACLLTYALAQNADDEPDGNGRSCMAIYSGFELMCVTRGLVFQLVLPTLCNYREWKKWRVYHHCVPALDGVDVLLVRFKIW